MLVGMKKKLIKRVIAFAVAVTMVTTLVDASTVTALAAEASSETSQSTETPSEAVASGSSDNQITEVVDDVDDSTIENAVENPVDETAEEETTDESEEDESLLSTLSETVEEALNGLTEKTYKDFTEDEVVADLSFSKDVTKDSLYDEETGYGFSKVEYPTAATGWSGSIYYPRVAATTDSDASYVAEADGALAITSKVWTETESTGYGVYTYDNTSVFQYDADNADYTVDVTLTNPTSAEYSAYVRAEGITKASGITVAAGASVTQTFTVCLVDGQISLEFLGTSSATSESAASEQTVYVSNVKITRQATNEEYTSTDGTQKPTVFIASDSTVQSYDSYYYPQTGWGQVLAEFFGDGDYEEVTSANCGYSQAKTYEVSNAVIENRAIGGRSSSSFVTEGKLDDLLEDVAPGDYLLIQWGHNDATYSRPNRYVSTTYDTDGDGTADFEEWLQYYIDGAIQRGATPVLVTPVARYSYTTDSDGNLISYASNFEAYRQVMIKMSKEQGIALVDLTQRSIDVANSFGIDGGKSLWLWTNAGDYTGAYAGGSSDSTHLQWYGAYKFAQCVATGIKEAGASETYTNENNSSSDNKAALAALGELIDLRAATTAPEQVTGLKSGTVGASSISMSWDEEKNSELYYIYRAEVDSEEAGEAYTFSDTDDKYSVSRSCKYTDSGCEGGKTYVYAIRGFNSMGLSDFSDKIVVSTKSAGYRFDFNYNSSATQDGWTGINQNTMYDAEVGYGWTTAPGNGRSRGNNGTVSDDLADMAADFCLGAGTFAVDLPNGDYEITVYAADLLSGTSTIKTSYTVEGTVIGGCSCKQSLGSVTAQVRVTDGQMNITVGGTNQYINGLTITQLLLAPTGLTESEAGVSGNKYTALLAFNGIDEAAGYNYYIKGTTDTEFKLERTFTADKYLEGVTVYGAISVNLGENYQYYVTAYTEDGTESAPSNTITVEALLDVDAPLAPTNVVCTDPTEDTEGVQHSITIAWDASKVVDSTYPVIKYIVYRSAKAEDAKGFEEFEKIGETTELTYTDTDSDLSTNIHYYYKVCASNAGGAGELSEACETPITGSLVAGNQETLTDRALYAIALSDDVKGYDTKGNELTSGVYLSWRAFEEEFDSDNNLTTTFTVYCNDEVIASDVAVTNMVYEGGKKGDVFKVVGSADASVNGGLKVVETKAVDNQYIEYSLNKPEDETMPDASTCSYTANDMSVGDVDGDGVLELIVKWYPTNAKDNSGSGYTGKTFLDTYDIDWASSSATLLSRIDLGVNIRSGAHYVQFQVWDYDGDGKAEVAVKTADGTTSYDGNLKEVAYVGACDTNALPTDTVSAENDYRNTSGYILTGPEYFSIFNLEDGTKAADDVDYTPDRGTVSKWGDAYGNRVDRFLACTAYLDGEHPFAVMCRGYYTRTTLTAYGMKDTDDDGVADTIYELWAYDTDNGDGPEGQGNHNLSVADVDNDGKDEIVYGSSCYDHDGTLKYSTGLGHGDAMHVSDWIPSNEGLEVMEVHEEQNQTYQVEIHDAETGEIITGYPVANTDVGRGVAADIDPTAEGAEYWASNGPSGEGTGEWDSTDASVIATEGSGTSSWNVLSYGVTPSVNATLYWDGDLLAEIQDHVFESKNGYYPISTYIAKWNYETDTQEKLLSTDEIYTSNGTKGNLGLIADLTGDWRDEFIARCSADDSKIRLYETTYVTDYVVPCALDDLEYREGVAWENTGYNQPTHTSYLVSEGLVTAKLSVADEATDSLTINFTPASDGTLYGHDVTAYEIYRDGELIDTVAVKDLKTVGNASTETEEEETVELTKPEEVSQVSYKFDFGATATADGYTQVTATDVYADGSTYGFTSSDGANGKWATATTATKSCVTVAEDDDLNLIADRVLFTGSADDPDREFVVDVPNGTYDVTYTIAGVNVYNAVTAEGESIETNKFRFGNTGSYATVTATVTVTDGQLNFVETASKTSASYYIDFTAITVSETDDSFATRKAAYDEALAAYEAQEAAKTSTDEEETVDENYGLTQGSYKFDFGAGTVEDGYTQVKADAAYSSETGYGFADLTGAGNGTYSAATDALLSDNVTFYDKTTTSKEFKVDLPDGTYNVTYSVAGVNCYNAVTAEGTSIETNKFRFGSAGGSNTVTATVEVTDGQLNFVQTISKSGYFNIIFTAIDIEETDDSFAARVAVAKAEAEAAEETEASSNTAGYVYTDSNLKSNTSYTYQIAAVVDGKTSYMSKAFTATTLIKIASVNDFELDNIVCGTLVTTDATELLPATATVVDEEGNEQQAAITWDITGLDINTVGDYTVTGTVKGYSETLTKSVKVVPNEIKGVEELEALKVVVGSSSANLPETVKVEYTNGTSDTVAVTWNTEAFDINTVGSYEITGTIEGYDFVPSITVNVVEDYPVSIPTTTIEVNIGDKIVANLPATVSATMASGNTANVAVTWKTDGVDDIDTSSSSEQMIHGTVEGYDSEVLCDVVVTYKALYKFDFGISSSVAADGWTTVTVNPKGGEKTLTDLGLVYSEDKGWGFLGSDSSILQGRTESVTGSGLYPTNVTTDFMLSAGLTFVVDVPNGDYLVQVMSTCGIGNSSATIDVEGTSASFSNSKGSFTVKEYEVTVTDGQLTIKDNSSLSRIGAIVIRDRHVHTAAEAVVENKVEATCTEAGSYDSVIYCSGCGEEISRETIEIPATNHENTTISEENRVEATCTEAGSYDSVTTCADCGVELDRTTVEIPATGHTETTTLTEAGFGTEGSIVVTCSVCGEEISNTKIAAVSSAAFEKSVYAVTGETIQPAVTVTDADGNTLVEGTDFDVEYSGDGTTIGSYTATVTLKGNYTGSKTIKYSVVSQTTADIVDTVTEVVETVTNAVTKLVNIFKNFFHRP